MGSRAAPAFHPHRADHTNGGGEKTGYARRRPEESVLYGVVQAELETFLARAQARERLVPRFVERELLEGERCASGVSLHANVAVPARDRRRLGG